MNRPGFPPIPFFAALAALATLAAVGLLVRMSEYGPVIGWDSVHYISVARSLLNGGGFVAADGGRFEAWAPLYPMLLAATGALASVDPRDAAGPLNAALYGLCVLVAGAWMRRSMNSRFLIVWGCLAVALSPPLTLAATHALSETAFILFATLALTRMDRHLADGGRSSLLWAAVFTGLAWATRYVGVVVVVASVAALAGRREVSLYDKAKELALYSLVSTISIGVWTSRNFLVTGSFVPSGVPVDYTLPEAAEGISGAIGALLAASGPQGLAWREIWPALQVTLGGLSLLALAAALIVTAIRTRARDQTRDSGSSFRLFGSFVILYVGFYAWTTVAGNTWHGVQLRHLLPVYIPLLFSAMLAADRLLGHERQQRPAMPRGTRMGTVTGLLLAATLSIWIMWIAPAHLRGTLKGEGTHEGHSFYNRDSEVMRYLRDNPSDADLYSNAPYFAYANGAPGAGRYLYIPANRPYARFVGDSDPRDLLSLFLESVGDGDRVVWLFDQPDNHLFDYDAVDMRAHAGLRLVADLADGAVFEVDRTFGGKTDEWLSVALAAEPDVRAIFDVRVRENYLIYSKTPCTRADTRAKFFLHVWPADERNLPDERKRYGFLGLDFDFKRLRVELDETCVTVIALPNWRIARMLSGQFTGYNRLWGASTLWEVEVPPSGARADSEPPSPETERQP